VVIDDFRTLTVDGRMQKAVRPGKGHVEGLKAFRNSLGSSGSSVQRDYVLSSKSMRASFAVLNRLAERSRPPSRE
jgi:hypothetical protein